MNNPKNYTLTLLAQDPKPARTYTPIERMRVDAYYPGDVLTRTVCYTPDWSITESGPTTIATSADKTLRYAVCED